LRALAKLRREAAHEIERLIAVVDLIADDTYVEFDYDAGRTATECASTKVAVTNQSAEHLLAPFLFDPQADELALQ
jgi:hypothetical protein